MTQTRHGWIGEAGRLQESVKGCPLPDSQGLVHRGELPAPVPADERNEGIVPRRSLPIADLGPDMPVMLDYRESPTAPRVLYMNDTVWVQVAAN
ncbi:hypothetical protein [Streptomyces sp. NPDC088726]|uniref:hypothetical protein n=1 Tax=Streptomyces sp. NPDC088726 TaxID=3365874 RepID=UPI0038296E1A